MRARCVLPKSPESVYRRKLSEAINEASERYLALLVEASRPGTSRARSNRVLRQAELAKAEVEALERVRDAIEDELSGGAE